MCSTAFYSTCCTGMPTTRDQPQHEPHTHTASMTASQRGSPSKHACGGRHLIMTGTGTVPMGIRAVIAPSHLGLPTAFSAKFGVPTRTPGCSSAREQRLQVLWLPHIGRGCSPGPLMFSSLPYRLTPQESWKQRHPCIASTALQRLGGTRKPVCPRQSADVDRVASAHRS